MRLRALAGLGKVGYAPKMFRNAIARLKETHLATKPDRWMTGGIAVLLVLLGFLIGRWSSVTSASTPMVFQEAPYGGSSVASPEELRALVAGATDATAPGSTSEPAVRGATTTTAQQPPNAPPTSGTPAGAFVASANGAKYYLPSCPEVKRINEDNKLWFDSAEEARESGYEPSVCLTKANAKK